jgi:flavin reductase (DIM6/NTAB) family NADH-FMN oxidoreductase RutF
MTLDSIADQTPHTLKQMQNGGLFLTTKGEKLNTMVIGWGGINVYFRRPVFIVPVRLSRFTHQLIEGSSCFTVSVPREGELKKALSFCGSKSGRDYDKFTECGLTAVPGRNCDVPVIGECALHYECEIIYSQHMDEEKLKEEVDREIYPNSVYHTFYFGQILDCYSL